MQLYGNYLDVIRQTINSPELKKGHVLNQVGGMANYGQRSFDKGVSESVGKLEPATSLTTLARLLGKPVQLPKTGDHPDFTHLRHEYSLGYDYHYISSVFMDVKNSTSFFRKYTLEQIPPIIQAIVTAATHTCALFDGHIQRMQYDGVFAYFGGRNLTKEQAVKNAIDATAFFTYFVKYELPTVFEAIDVDAIFTRTGIDFGDDEETIWSIYGSGDCTELTTTSLHTSLSPKMQHKASSNGIMIGDNVKKRLGLNTEFADFKRDAYGRVDENERYIFRDPEESFYYSQYTFDWEKYLRKTYDFIQVDDKGKLYISYNANASDHELARQRKVADATRQLESGESTLDRKLNIITGTSGLPVPKERNFYDDSRGY